VYVIKGCISTDVFFGEVRKTNPNPPAMRIATTIDPVYQNFFADFIILF